MEGRPAVNLRVPRISFHGVEAREVLENHEGLINMKQTGLKASGESGIDRWGFIYVSIDYVKHASNVRISLRATILN